MSNADKTKADIAEEAVSISVRGRVQGVGFRAWTVRLARKYAVKGAVYNNDDGTVGVIAEGSRALLASFMQALESSHPYARVDCLDWEKIPVRGFNSFDIVY